MNYWDLPAKKRWKYAQKEWERRYLLSQQPTAVNKLSPQFITDKYLYNSCIRIRKVVSETGILYKLSKKLPLDQRSEPGRWVSTIYLDQGEYNLFMELPGDLLTKQRFTLTPSDRIPIAIDTISLGESSICVAEVELKEKEFFSYIFPLPFEKELTHDTSFQGSELAKLQSGNR